VFSSDSLKAKTVEDEEKESQGEGYFKEKMEDKWAYIAYSLSSQ
jgi:hypothetical protein